jgi:hypothetical protein
MCPDQTTITIVYRGREGRRVGGRYEIRFLARTSDGQEFWAHGNQARADALAIEHIKRKGADHADR